MKPADSWCSFSDDGDYSSGKCTAGACVERTKCADVNMPACWKLATSAPTYGDGSKEMCGVHSQGDCMSQGDSAGGSCLAGTCKAKPLCSVFVQPTCMVASSKKYGDTEADCSVSATVGADCKTPLKDGKCASTGGASPLYCAEIVPKCSDFAGDFGMCRVRDSSKNAIESEDAWACSKNAASGTSCTSTMWTNGGDVSYTGTCTSTGTATVGMVAVAMYCAEPAKKCADFSSYGVCRVADPTKSQADGETDAACGKDADVGAVCQNGAGKCESLATSTFPYCNTVQTTQTASTAVVPLPAVGMQTASTAVVTN